MVSKHCDHYSKANRILGMIKRTFKTRDSRLLLSLYYKTMVHPHLEYCSSAWSPHYQKDKKLLEKVQHRFTRLFADLRNLTYDERLHKLGLWALEERRICADLLKSGLSSVPMNAFFDLNVDSRTRGHSWKIVKKRCKLDIRKYFFSEMVIQRWNHLSQDAVDQAMLNGFKRALNKRRINEMDFSWTSCPPSLMVTSSLDV